MNVDDRQDDAPQEPRPDEQPTEPMPRRRLTRSRNDRVIGGVCGGMGRYFNVDPMLLPHRRGRAGVPRRRGSAALPRRAAAVPSEDAEPLVAPGTQGRNRALVIAGVVVLLLIAWPFLLGGGLLLAGIGIPLALLVGTGVLVWWLVSGEGPSGDAGDIARRAALGVGVLILCGFLALGGALGRRGRAATGWCPR